MVLDILMHLYAQSLFIAYCNLYCTVAASDLAQTTPSSHSLDKFAQSLENLPKRV